MDDQEILEQLLGAYRLEAPEHVEQINKALIHAENADPAERAEQLKAAARAAHNLKGIAATVELEVPKIIAHELESVVERIGPESDQEAQAYFDLCYEILDTLQAAIAEERSAKLPRPLLNRVRGILENSRPPDKPEGIDEAPPEPAPAPPVPSPSPPPESAPAQPPVVQPPAPAETRVSTVSDPPPPAELAPAEESAPAATGKPVVPDEERLGIRVDPKKIDVLLSQTGELLLANIRQDHRLREMRGVSEALAATTREVRRHLEELWETPVAGVGSGGQARRGRNEAWLRGHLQHLRTLGGRASSLYSEMTKDSMNLTILSQDMQEDVRRLRMFPLAGALEPTRRVARDVARRRGKKVRVDIHAHGIEVDKTILDELKDPLGHIIRNAVDHGLESPQERELRGKDPCGMIVIQAHVRGSILVITLRDDGQGVDRMKVSRKAAQAGLIREGTVVSDEEAAELIFHPGFTTAAELSDTSGRGVGLDVVRAKVRSIEGNVRVRSQEGKWCEFSLSMPLSLSTTRGLLFTVADHVYALPIHTVDRILRVAPDSIEEIGGQLAVRVGGDLIPLVFLDQLLGLGPGAVGSRELLYVLLLASENEQLACVCEGLEGEQDIVIKQLGLPLRRVPNVAGAALRGTGTAVVVLSAVDLMESARDLRNRQLSGGGDAMPLPTLKPPPAKHILVVEDAFTARTLEKNILETAGYAVEVATNGSQAWEYIQSRMYDLVVTDVSMPVLDGFELLERIRATDRLRDVPVILVTARAQPEERARGLELGANAYILKGHFDQQQFLDAVATADMSADIGKHSVYRVVLADDSTVARSFLRNVIEADGDMRVIAEAETGQEAVALVQEHSPDLLVTDVRMPGMDGIEATREVMELAPVPVVVVSGELREEALPSFEALEAGAVDILRKPTRGAFQTRDRDGARFRRTLRLMAEVKVVRRKSAAPVAAPAMYAPPAPMSADEPAVTHTPSGPPPMVESGLPVELVALGASTGGPPAIDRLLRMMPRIPVPLIIVQHIMSGFTKPFAAWLRSSTGHDVRVAQPGELAKPGRVLVAPETGHITVRSDGEISIARGLPVGGHRPSADVLFESLAMNYGARAAGVLLTGMGEDGAKGLKTMRDAGSLTIAEAQSSCVVYGMPKAAVDLDAASVVAPLRHIPRVLESAIGIGSSPNRRT